MVLVKSKNIPPAEQWVDDYGDYLFSYAHLRINNRQLAEDLVQETFLSALKARDTFNNKSTVKTWLTSILKHKILDTYRKSATSVINTLQAADLSEFITEGENKGQWDPHYTPKILPEMPDSLLENIEFTETLQRCLFETPDPLRIIFTMRVIDGMSTDDVCKELSVTSSNFWVMMHRARSFLRRCFEINWFAEKKRK